MYAHQSPGGEDGPDAYLEPFMGGGSVMTEVLAAVPREGREKGWLGPAYFGDANPALVTMWESLQLGWVPPFLGEGDYTRAREEPDPMDAETAYLGFGGSFGAMWFGSRKFYPDQLEATRRSLLRTRNVLLARRRLPFKTEIVRRDYRDWTDFLAAIPRAVVYCDPPYAGTLPYPGAEGGLAFDHGEFWVTMRAWAAMGHTVLVSEYQAPAGTEQLWERTMRGKLTRRGAAQDRLFLVRP